MTLVHLTVPTSLSVFLVLMLGAFAAPAPGQQPFAEVEIMPQEIVIFPTPSDDFLSMTVRIVDPRNRKVLDTTTWGGVVAWSPQPDCLEGYYRFEVTVILKKSGGTAWDEELEQDAPSSRQEQISGLFELSGGQIIDKSAPTETETGGKDSRIYRHSTAVLSPDELDVMAVQEYTDSIRLKTGQPVIYFNDTVTGISDDEFSLDVAWDEFYITDRLNNNSAFILKAGASNADSIVVETNGDVALTDDEFYFDRSEGNLGIGTTTPPHDLSIYSPFVGIELEDSDSSSSANTSTGTNMRGGIFLTTDQLMLFTRSFSGTSSWPLIIRGVPWSDSLTIVSQNADTRVADEGYVGLGTLTPQAKLHIKSGTGTAQVVVEESEATTAVRTQFQLKNNGAPRFALENTNSGTEWSFQQSGPGNFLISKEGTGGPEMQVYQTGMVRMGPGGANRFTLYPNGNLVIAGSLTANGSTFPDYVFEPDYNLMPLSDLRTFIQQERRLPNLPSAEEVKTQGGHNMTELQLKLLEKIEELTLYALEQEERLRQIEQENARIRAENLEMKTAWAEIRPMLSEQ